MQHLHSDNYAARFWNHGSTSPFLPLLCAALNIQRRRCTTSVIGALLIIYNPLFHLRNVLIVRAQISNKSEWKIGTQYERGENEWAKVSSCRRFARNFTGNETQGDSFPRIRVYESCGKTMDSVRFARIRLARLLSRRVLSSLSEIRRRGFHFPIHRPLSFLPFFRNPSSLLVYLYSSRLIRSCGAATKVDGIKYWFRRRFAPSLGPKIYVFKKRGKKGDFILPFFLFDVPMKKTLYLPTYPLLLVYIDESKNLFRPSFVRLSFDFHFCGKPCEGHECKKKKKKRIWRKVGFKVVFV